jgi:membrane protease YdiL (CAAX protease family)
VTDPHPGTAPNPAGHRGRFGPGVTHPVRRSTRPTPRATHPGRYRVPRWGSVADPGTGGAALSTAPWSGVVVAGGLVFLLARPTVVSLPSGVALLAGGYLALLVGAVAVRARREDGPLGWGVPLALGLVAVAGAGMVAGPVADRRVGVVAAGLALLAAVAEEALFRRVLYDRLLRFGVVTAVVGSAVVFALIHLPSYGLAAMPVDLGAALLLSWQRYASGRWTVPAVTHAVANLLAVT